MSTVDTSRAARAQRIAEETKEREPPRVAPLVFSKPKIEKQAADHIYLNVSAPPFRTLVASSAHVPVQLLDKRDQPIIEDPENWYLSVVRFNMPTSLIPIAYMPIYTGIFSGSPSTFINLTTYTITIIAPDGTPFTEALNWIPEDPTIVPPTPPSTGITEDFIKRNIDYYSMFNYQTLLDMINRAFSDLQVLASTNLSWPADATLAPYMTLDRPTGICSLWAQTAYDSTLTTPIKIYFNTELYELFQSTFLTEFNGFHPVDFSAGVLPEPDWQIIIKNEGNTYVPNVANNFLPFTLPAALTTGSNVITMADTDGLVDGQTVTGPGIPAGTILVSFVADTSATLSENVTLASSPLTTNVMFTAAPQPGFKMSQDYAALILWTDFAGISFTTGSLPVKSEYAAVVYAADTTSPGPAGKGAISPIITDFVASSTGSGTDLRTYVTYIPSGEYRLTSLLSGKAIDTIQLNMYWVDFFGNLFQINCTNNTACTAKLMFRRRDRKFVEDRFLGHGLGESEMSGGDLSRGKIPGTLIMKPGFNGQCPRCMSGGCASCSSEGLKGVI